MSATVQSLINRLHALGPERRADLEDAEIDEALHLLTEAGRDELDDLCRLEVASFDAGPLYWLTRLTKTENPQWEAQSKASGWDVPFLAPFPRKSYFVPLFGEFLARHDKLFVPKSRTMMTSWSAAAFAAWSGQWKHEETVIQCVNEDKALHLIDYVRQLMEYQELWLSARHPLAKRSSFTISWKAGGEVAAIPGGADAIRAYHPSTYIADEAAFIADGEQALNAVIPTGAKVICISTAAPGWFGDECTL